MKKLIDYTKGESLEINLKDLVRIDEKSFYNNNYYQLNDEVILIESVDDSYEVNIYLLVNGELEDLMGSHKNYKGEFLTGEVGTMYY